MATKYDFWDHFYDSFLLFFRKWKVFFGLMGVFFVAMILVVLAVVLFFRKNIMGVWAQPDQIPQFMQGTSPGSIFAMIFFLFVSMLVIQLIYQGARIFAANRVLKKKEVTVGESLGYGFRNMGGLFWTYLCAFWYIVKWPLLVWLVAVILFGVGAGFLTSSADTAGLLDGEAPLMPAEAVGNQPLPLLVSRLLAMSSMVALVVFIYFFISRGVRAVFSIYIFVDKGVSGNAAVKKSIEMVQGRWWRIFGYLFLMFLVFFAVGFVLSLVSLPFSAVGAVTGDPTAMLVVVGLVYFILNFVIPQITDGISKVVVMDMALNEKNIKRG